MLLYATTLYFIGKYFTFTCIIFILKAPHTHTDVYYLPRKTCSGWSCAKPCWDLHEVPRHHLLMSMTELSLVLQQTKTRVGKMSVKSSLYMHTQSWGKDWSVENILHVGLNHVCAGSFNCLNLKYVLRHQ